jgi:ABC-type arginine transport system ATPase subunit
MAMSMKYFIFIILLVISGCASKPDYSKQIRFLERQLSETNIRVSSLEHEVEKSKQASTKDVQFIIDNLPSAPKVKH